MYGLAATFINSYLRYLEWDFYNWESKSAMLGVCSQLPRVFRSQSLSFLPSLPPTKKGLMPELS